MCYGQQTEKDLEIFFDFIQAQKEEISLLWMTYPVAPTDAMGEPLCVPVIQKLLDKYSEADWMLYDETADIERGCILCDGYYGDPCWGGHRCEILEKPVRYMNYVTETKEVNDSRGIQTFYGEVLKSNIQAANHIEAGVGKKIWDEACKK